MNPDQLTAVFLVGGLILLIWLIYLSCAVARAHENIRILQSQLDCANRCADYEKRNRFEADLELQRRAGKIEEYLQKTPRFKP